MIYWGRKFGVENKRPIFWGDPTAKFSFRYHNWLYTDGRGPRIEFDSRLAKEGGTFRAPGIARDKKEKYGVIYFATPAVENLCRCWPSIKNLPRNESAWGQYPAAFWRFAQVLMHETIHASNVLNSRGGRSIEDTTNWREYGDEFDKSVFGFDIEDLKDAEKFLKNPGAGRAHGSPNSVPYFYKLVD